MLDRERIVQLFFFGFLALMAYLLYQLLDPFLVPIIWAMLLSFLFHPLMVDMHRFVRSRSLAAAILTLATALVAIIPALWFVVRLAEEAQTLSTAVSTTVRAGGLDKYREMLLHSPIGAAIAAALGRVGIRIEDALPAMAVRIAKLTSEYLMGHVTDVARNLASFFWDFIIILFTLFYLLRDGEGYYEAIRNLTPLHEEDKRAVYDTLRVTLSSVMRGLMVTAILQAVLIGAGLWVFDVPYWAFLSILTAVFGVFPFGGTAWVWAPAAAYLAYFSGWASAVSLVIWSAVAVALIDNFIKPWAMRQGTELPTIALFFGICGGLYAYGPLGLFLGPAVISIFAALLKVYRRTYGRAEREAA